MLSQGISQIMHLHFIYLRYIILSMLSRSLDGRCSFRTKEGRCYWLTVLNVACSAVNSRYKLKLSLLNVSADAPSSRTLTTIAICMVMGVTVKLFTYAFLSCAGKYLEI
jgi:hypothetical protein